MRRNGPRWLVPKVASKPSAVSWRSVRTRPALFTNTWMCWYRSSSSDAPARTDARSAKSNTTRSTESDPLALRMSDTLWRPLDSLRAAMTVWAPAPARATAVARPTPEFPPVMTTVLASMAGTPLADELTALSVPVRSAGSGPR